MPSHYIRGGQDFKPQGKHVDWRPLFPEREPQVGWFDDTQGAMDTQIQQAALGGVDFFAFEWFTPRPKPEHNYPGNNEQINNGPKLFYTSKYNRLMKFSLMYINSKPFEISTVAEWDHVIDEWIRYFQHPRYLKIGGKPLLIIHSVDMFRSGWNRGEMKARDAIIYLRIKAERAGFPDVLIGGGIYTPGPEMRGTSRDGYDFFTSFNYPLQWLLQTGTKEHDYSEFFTLEPNLWWYFHQNSPLPYVPVVTSGWDRRAQNNPEAPIAVYFRNRTPERYQALLESAKDTIDRSARLRLPGGRKMVMIYAWNELGEGGYIVPTKAEGDAYLRRMARVFGRASAN